MNMTLKIGSVVERQAYCCYRIHSPQIQSTVISQTQGGFDAVTTEMVQILHDREHWVTTGYISGRVVFMDSLRRPISQYVKKQMRQLYAHAVSENDELLVAVLPGCRQPNSYDCGVYAAAYAFHLALGRKAENPVFANTVMREHLAGYLKANMVTDFPTDAGIGKKRGRMSKEHLVEI